MTVAKGVIQSKRTITELIIQTALTISFGGGLDKYLKSDASGNAVWSDLMPHSTGGVLTKCLFYQTTAPSGWTIDASVNDYFLRVVSAGGGSTAGAWGLSISVTGNHTHSMNGHTHNLYGRTNGLSYDINPSNVDYGVVDDGVGWQHHLSGPTPCHLRVDGGANNEGQHDHYIVSPTNAPNTAYTDVQTANPSATTTHGSAQHKYANVILCTKN